MSYYCRRCKSHSSLHTPMCPSCGQSRSGPRSPSPPVAREVSHAEHELKTTSAALGSALAELAQARWDYQRLWDHSTRVEGMLSAELRQAKKDIAAGGAQMEIVTLRRDLERATRPAKERDAAALLAAKVKDADTVRVTKERDVLTVALKKLTAERDALLAAKVVDAKEMERLRNGDVITEAKASLDSTQKALEAAQANLVQLTLEREAALNAKNASDSRFTETKALVDRLVIERDVFLRTQSSDAILMQNITKDNERLSEALRTSKEFQARENDSLASTKIAYNALMGETRAKLSAAKKEHDAAAEEARLEIMRVIEDRNALSSKITLHGKQLAMARTSMEHVTKERDIALRARSGDKMEIAELRMALEKMSEQ